MRKKKPVHEELRITFDLPEIFLNPPPRFDVAAKPKLNDLLKQYGKKEPVAFVIVDPRIRKPPHHRKIVVFIESTWWRGEYCFFFDGENRTPRLRKKLPFVRGKLDYSSSTENRLVFTKERASIEKSCL